MAKYDPLRLHLAQLPDIEWTPSFGEIEEILGSALPASATEHRTWWANSGGLLVHQEAWLTAGWRVESVAISRRQVTFRRKGVGGAAAVARVRRAAQGDTHSNGTSGIDARGNAAGAIGAGALPAAMRKVLDASRKTVNLSARIDWTDIGVAERNAAGWRFPVAAQVPALCRFHVFSDDGHRILVMAVSDLNGFLRRLEGGGPLASDTTSKKQRVKVVLAAIAGAEFIVVDAATPGQAWILVDGQGRKADLTDEDESWLVARAAAVVDRQAGHESTLVHN